MLMNLLSKAATVAAVLKATHADAFALNLETKNFHWHLHASLQASTTRSISTQAPSGSAATAIVVRAGKGSVKCFA